MTVGAITVNKKLSDVLFVSESLKSSFKLVAYDLSDFTNPKSHILQNESGKVSILRAGNGGSALVAIAGNALIVGALKRSTLHSVEDLVYDFYSVNATDDICCLSIRHTAKKLSPKGKASHDPNEFILDVAVGCARGAIFTYSDLLTQLQCKSKKGLDAPKKRHWHQKAVHSVTWSNDGMFTKLLRVRHYHRC